MSADGKSAAEMFNETPSWYNEPELSAEQLDSELVPPKRHSNGKHTAMGYVPERQSSGMSGSSLGVIIFSVLALVVFGGFAFLFLVGGAISGGSGSDELAAGGCVAPQPSGNSIGFSAVAADCDSGNPDVGEVLGTFDAIGLDQMPGENDAFWEDAAVRCTSMDEETIFAFGIPTAQSNQDWESGEHTVVCASFGIFDDMLADLDDAFSELES